MLLLLLIGILLASCAPSTSGQPTPDILGTTNALAGTMAAALFQTQTALAPSATVSPIATVTSLSSPTALSLSTPTTSVQQPVLIVSTATPTGTYYTATPLASSLGSGCKNLRLINSWTEPEGPFIPGQQFTQVWQVENNGTCEWLYLFEMVFASGDKLGDATSVRFGNKIPPEKWTTLQVGMRAPNKSGTFKASWRMTDGAGTSFGAVLPVSITVGGSTNTPKPDTAATAVAETVGAQNAINTAVAGTQTQACVDVGGVAPPCTP